MNVRPIAAYARTQRSSLQLDLRVGGHLARTDFHLEDPSETINIDVKQTTGAMTEVSTVQRRYIVLRRRRQHYKYSPGMRLLLTIIPPIDGHVWLMALCLFIYQLTPVPNYTA